MVQSKSTDSLIVNEDNQLINVVRRNTMVPPGGYFSDHNMYHAAAVCFFLLDVLATSKILLG